MQLLRLLLLNVGTIGLKLQHPCQHKRKKLMSVGCRLCGAPLPTD